MPTDKSQIPYQTFGCKTIELPARTIRSGWFRTRVNEYSCLLCGHRGRREYSIPGCADKLVIQDNRGRLR